MINDVIRHLQKASVRPNDFTSRYSELLDRLWQRKDSEVQSHSQSQSRPPNPAPSQNNNSSNRMPESSGFVSPPAPLRSVPGYTGIQNGLQDEFSWLDLQAVGVVVSGSGGNGEMPGFGNMESGSIPF